ncbi:MBL fold metallo-hydrolase [Ktedonospora formicarum]|uniref:Metallo-beta-lactamase domain-containing protein n=1 Tax=Ktedonospora formicarum TaxID=2778364 RepID=A0A8J3HVS0_9CHLR|nr:MBL fold metallo-hydrolase [Ktedonospora formicarum]GHO41895.1 hypothetical protein KSX_00580 [Ktedonospora formicarum]
MRIQLIRSATLRITYAGHTFLIDPYLAAKHTMPSFTGASPNPLVDLPCSPQEVLADCEMVVISHLHSDHFDAVAQSLLSKDMPIFCQPGDETTLSTYGFQNVSPITHSILWKSIQITRTDGQHGSGEVSSEMGQVSGFLFQHEQEPSLYWAGDTIWCEVVEDTIEREHPSIIVTHSCGAVWRKSTLIVMDAQQTMTVCQRAPESVVIATHMDSLDHATVSRRDLFAVAREHRIRSDQLFIPQDGEVLIFGE